MDEYIIWKAAQYCQTTPWDMENQPVFWRNHALEFKAVEARVEEEMTRQAKQKAQRGHRRRG